MITHVFAFILETLFGRKCIYKKTWTLNKLQFMYEKIFLLLKGYSSDFVLHCEKT